MSTTEHEEYRQLPLPIPGSQPNQFTREPLSNPLPFLEEEKIDEGSVTEEYKEYIPEEDLGDKEDMVQDKTPNVPQEDNHSWVYDSSRRTALAYAGHSRANPADKD